jgi:hypothetical protein
MRRLTRRTYRWMHRLGACLGAVCGVVVLALETAAEDAAFARVGAHRVDVSPFALPMYLALGALAGWIIVVLAMHFAAAVPLEDE